MKALYAGSFDPFTIGHLDIAIKALKLFGSLTIGIGYNENKRCEWTPAQRVRAIKELFKNEKNIEVKAYSGLTVEFAKSIGAQVLVRGVRNSLDFEKEKELADINSEIEGIQTVMIPSKPELTFVSSSMVRELIHNGRSVEKYIAGDFSLPSDNN